MASILVGLLAGFVGSVVMAILMMAMSKGQPGVNTMLVARATHKSPDEAKMGGMIAHFVYGTAMGAIFVLGSGLVLVGGSWRANGLLFSILLFLVATMLVMPAAGLSREMMRRMPRGQVVGFLILHLVYGAILAGIVTYAG